MTIADRMLALVSPLIADRHDDGLDPVDDADDDNGGEPGDEQAHHDTEGLRTLLRWLQIDRFDRRTANLKLAHLELMPVRAAA